MSGRGVDSVVFVLVEVLVFVDVVVAELDVSKELELEVVVCVVDVLVEPVNNPGRAR